MCLASGVEDFCIYLKLRVIPAQAGIQGSCYCESVPYFEGEVNIKRRYNNKRALDKALLEAGTQALCVVCRGLEVVDRQKRRQPSWPCRP
jgi:hypothetical protein